MRASHEADRRGHPLLDHPLGPSWHRQDDARGAPALGRGRGRLPAAVRRQLGVSDARCDGPPKTTLFRTVLFVDEVHRWNKAQQEILLPAIEDGSITLIGATTENCNTASSARCSRCFLLRLEPLEAEEIRGLLEIAVLDERGMGALGVTLTTTRSTISWSWPRRRAPP